MNNKSLVRDVFNTNLIEEIAKQLKTVYPDFKSSKFLAKAVNFDSETGLKDRAKCIARALVFFLPDDFTKSAQIITSSFNQKDEKESNWKSFFYMPYTFFVEWEGCKKEHLNVSYDLLKEITKRFTSEFAIRPFIINFPKQTLPILKNWTSDENHHVRRLVSEGSRPRLPWSKVLKRAVENPIQSIELLELLKNDESKYVQRSVANHINDITKDNPKIALDVLARWKKENNQNTNWIVKHALRNELKKGTPKALEILGFSLTPKVQISQFELSHNCIHIGDDLHIKFIVVNIGKTTANLLIDYKCYFMKSNGKTSPKIFKIRTKNIKKGESLTVCKKQSFKLISTRKIYPGKHKMEILINGVAFDSLGFHLVA